MAFVLMPNHYHLVMREIVDGGISSFMQKMCGYAGYFNKKHNRVGSLFQSRYKAIPMQSEGQLGIIFQYVHTNPVELKEPQWKEHKVKNKEEAIDWLKIYRWSSYHDYIGKPTFPAVIKRDFFLDFFGGEQKCRKVVEDWVSFKARKAQLEEKDIE